MRIARLPGALMLAAMIVGTGAVWPMPALALASIRLTYPIGNACVLGTKPTMDPVKVKLLRSDGTALETQHDNTTDTDWSVCFHRTPRAGNKIRVENGSVARTVTLPELTLRVDRATSVVDGHGPAGRHLHLHYLDCGFTGCVDPVAVGVSVKGNGRYHKDFGSKGIDIDGGDIVAVEYDTDQGDRFVAETVAPYMEIRKPNRISASCLPIGHSTIRLRSSGGSLRAIRSFTSADACTFATGSFRKDGHPVNVHVGDVVSSDLASDARLTWPEMSVNGQGTTLSGRCLADAPWAVSISRGDTNSNESGTTDADGHFAVTVATAFQGGDRLDLICATPRGDKVRMVRTL